MFNVALFTITKILNKPRFLLMDEYIHKVWCIYTTEYYSTIKKNEVLSFAAKCMELEDIMLSEISQAQKDECCMFSLTHGS